MTMPKYFIKELSKHYRDTFWWRNRFLQHIVGPLQEIIYGSDGIDIMTQDWDNLLILDACRADYFEEAADISLFDEYRVVQSKASATPEFVAKTFAGREFGDTVYVNSNPHISRDAPGSFHERYDLWSNAFNEEYHTVLPEAVNECGVRAESEHPEKRLILHYNQPHGPYVGDDGLSMSAESLSAGQISKQEFKTAYRSNLELVLPSAIELSRNLTGRTVITADHGELFGKRQVPIPIKAYAHPPGLRDPDLVRVPWAVIDDGESKEIVDEGTNVAEVAPDVVNERLEDLGYKA